MVSGGNYKVKFRDHPVKITGDDHTELHLESAHPNGILPADGFSRRMGFSDGWVLWILYGAI